MKRGEKIPHDLDTTPLLIKTDSIAGSEERVEVDLYNARGSLLGWVVFDFYQEAEYEIGSCTNYEYLPSTVPSETNKVWQITKLPGPRITLQCNGVVVVDILMSDDTCVNRNWKIDWVPEVKQISFNLDDTASDFMRSAATAPGWSVLGII